LSDPYNPIDDVNLRETRSVIAMGNPRVSWVVDSMLKSLEPNFFVDRQDPNRIRNRMPEAGEEEWYEDNLSGGGYLYAVLVRRRQKNRTETVLLVQNGPALEALAGVLTNEEELEKLVFQDPGWRGALPSYFECLFQVSLGNLEVVERGTKPVLLALRTHHWKAAGR
jgi:hypothetical protein